MNELSREKANKIMLVLNEQPPQVVYEALLIATLSMQVHQAKDVGDVRVTWVDNFRAISNNYIQQLKQYADATARKNEFQLSSNIIALPAKRKLITPTPQ